MNVTSTCSSDEEWNIDIDFFDNNNYFGVPRRYCRVPGELWQNYSPGEYFKMAMNKFHYFIHILYTIIVYFGWVCIESDQEQLFITHSCHHLQVKEIKNLFYIWRKCAICTSYTYILWGWRKMVMCSDCRIFMHDKCHKALLHKAKPQIDDTIAYTDCTKQIINVSPDEVNKIYAECNQEHDQILQLDVKCDIKKVSQVVKEISSVAESTKETLEVIPVEVANNKIYVDCININEELKKIHNFDGKEDLKSRPQAEEKSNVSESTKETIEVIPTDEVANNKIHTECKIINEEETHNLNGSSSKITLTKSSKFKTRANRYASTMVALDGKCNSTAKDHNKLLKLIKHPTESKILTKGPSQKTAGKTRPAHKTVELYVYGTLFEIHNCGVDEFFDDGRAVFAYCGTADHDDDRFAAVGTGALFAERFGKPRREHRVLTITQPSYVCLQEQPGGGKVYMLVTKETADSPSVGYHRAMMRLKQRLDGAGDARLTIPPLGLETDGIAAAVFAEKVKTLFLRNNIGVRLCVPDRAMCRQLVNAFFSTFPACVRRTFNFADVMFS